MSELDNFEGEKGESVASKTKDAATNQAKKSAKKGIEKLVKKEGTKAVARHSIGAALAPILFWVVVVIVALIIIIGILMFFITMPGMVLEQIKALAKEIGDTVSSWFGEGSEEQVDNKDIYEVLDYLEQMGYDLKGYGFLTDYKTSVDQIDDDANKDEGVKLDKDVGVIRNDNEKIISAKSDFVYSYLVSENYIYTIKNFNVNTDSKLLAVWDHFTALFTDNLDNRTGMIAIYHEGSKGIGDTSTDLYDASEWGSIKCDPNSKSLSIKKNSFLNSNNAMSYSLDGWVGRYGMPIDFLLSLQVATMMPDLAYDMTDNFATEIKILLHSTSGEVDGLYKTKNGEYVTYEELSNELNGVAGRNIFSALIASIDELNLSAEEANTMIEKGIVPPFHDGTSCGCEKTESYLYKDDNDVPHYVYKEESEDGDKYYYIDYSTDMMGVKVYLDDISNLETITTLTKVGSDCKEFLKAAVKYMRKGNDYDYETYVPYIENVTDHWYRDVYYIMDTNKNKNFVDYDYNYESLTKERWTLYETDDDTGEYCYYKVDANGDLTDERYYPTQKELEQLNDTENASHDRQAFAKKAETINIANEYEDLSWNDLSDKGLNGVYSSYNTESSETTDYQNPYSSGTDAEKSEIYNSASDIVKKALDNIYVAVNIGSVTQTGEGQRTETNSKIKKMFLNNTYFRYDGKPETAEIITALRKSLNLSYGAIDTSTVDMTKKHDLSAYGIDKEYSVKDVSGQVSINQDSLNAFSMLENEHTLDSDYIYRDFKELIVELGYFEKEELVEEKPKVMEYIVPDIPSAGYPKRSIDKNEHEYGTMLHSSGDIEVNNRILVEKMYSIAAEEVANGERDENIESGSFDEASKTEQPSAAINPVKALSLTDKLEIKRNISEIVRGMGSDYERIPESGDGYEYKVKHGNATFTHYYQFSGSYKDSTFTWSGLAKTIHQAACGPTSCVNLLTGYGEDVNPTKDIIGLNFDATVTGCGVFMEEHGVTGQAYSGLSDAEYITKIKEAFSENRPIITLMHQSKTGDAFWTNGGHFVAMIGQDNQGNIITLDSGSSSPERHTYTGGVEGLMSCLDGVWIADEAPDGSAAAVEGAYVGYEGNEAVVSPVTGILLDYGIYNPESTAPEDIDSITGLGYRVNTDLKYGNAYEKSATEASSSGESGTSTGENSGEEAETGEIQLDGVGYAKILVLDAENYSKFESSIQSSTVFKDKGSFVGNTGNFKDYNKLMNSDLNEDEIENWKLADYTLYGYKKFAESYEEAGISGNIVYIDGFVPELPDTELSGESESSGEAGGSGESTEPEGTDSLKISEQIPNGEEIKKEDYFDKITSSNIEDEEQLESRYVADEEYSMASKKATEKYNTEVAIKTSSSTSYKFTFDDKDYTIIKEGTVIGRTMTDKELITEIRKQDETKYKEYRPDSSSDDSESEDENYGKIMGNYLRIYMNNAEDDTHVENVEDYMKIDELGDDSFVAVDQEYKAWPKDLEVLAEVFRHESGGWGLLSKCNVNGEKEAEFNGYCMGYSVVNKLLEQNSQYYGHLYDSSRTDMSPLVQVVTNQKAVWYGNPIPAEATNVWNGGKGCYSEEDLKFAEHCLKYDCTSIKKEFDTKLSSETVADGYTSTEVGTPIPRAMCQQGGYGDGAGGQSGIILVGYMDIGPGYSKGDGQFNKGDELWGVDRSMESLINKK